MRLINVHTQAFEEFEGQDVPKYAILSHRWSAEEVTFKDMMNGTANQKKGFDKLALCCSESQKRGIDHVWIDTCCIDKSSSAELSEAINSMFRWYQNAEICLAHLGDVHHTAGNGQDLEDAFKNSVWFRRGWTLQELIAPRHIEFFDSQWVYLGDIEFFRKAIVSTTSIPHKVLTHKWPLRRLPIAQRMSWAAKRQTTRVEDRAYSLMGIFDVNMPMLYGEGDNAFRRLQEEIVKRSNDASILFWTGEPLSLFASSPSAFDIAPRLRNRSAWKGVDWPLDTWHFLTGEGLGPTGLNSEPSTITNLGLSISLPLYPWYYNTYIGLVAVIAPHSSSALYCFIYLHRPPYGSRLFRTSWQRSQIRCISKNEFHDLYRSYQFDDTLNNVRPIVISPESDSIWLQDEHENRVPGVITMCFQENTAWGPSGLPQNSDVITRNVLCLSNRTLKVQPVAPCEILAIFRLTLSPNHHKYLFLGYDEDFHLCLVLEDWCWPYHAYGDFETICAAGPNYPILRDLLQPHTFWAWTKTKELFQAGRAIKMERTPTSVNTFKLIDWNIIVRISCTAVQSYTIAFSTPDLLNET